MGAKQEHYNPIDDQADPEINQQTKVGKQARAAMLGSRRQMGHDQEIDHVPENDGSQRDEEVSRQTHCHIRHPKL